MPIKVDYVVRETTSNLGRNISITLASVLTVAVSLALVGGSLMLRTGIENATARWQGGIEFVVYLRTDATTEQIDSVGQALEESPEVANVKFFDQQASYEEFKRLFADSPGDGRQRRARGPPTLVSGSNRSTRTPTASSRWPTASATRPG